MLKLRWYKIYDFQEDGPEPHPLNTVRTIDVDGKLICLGRLADGYFAVDDRCPHAAGRLGMGKCDEEGYVICPIHRYRYHLKDGRGKQGDYVETYAIEQRKDGVWVGIRKKSWWPF